MKRRLTKKDFELLPTPVWVTTEMGIEPSPFFKNWWQNVAEQKFGNRERWLDTAVQLGYVAKFHEPQTGQLCHDPIGFDYDPVLYRTSLNVPEDMPLVRQDDSRQDGYQQLWKSLMSEKKEIKPNGK